ncbi:spermatogenesis associated 6-like protein [Danio rerio]|uniref:Spermatogenesis associated 6-like protein n=1 Tax=Danio rerio TaxID=7955 RepID=Q7T2B2_DANRE|nr:spermatogenesis associated 6-like protein [Danio rerio]AAH54618.1 Zgc:64105 [Danio rerio]|eukprot:NP_956706.1 spermatogenesis associated 6-like protein [Danio rerio]
MPHKAVKVIVELHLRAITCPGVHLPAKDDVYLSVSLMNRYRKTECLPAVFPILIREKIRFEKILNYATDPEAIAEFLQYEAVKIELIQLIPPAGEILASFEEDARSFLFPEPKLVPSFSGVEREVLMTRHPTFPGISPRLEFSTKTTISEISSDNGFLTLPVRRMRRKTSRKSRKQSSSSSLRHLSSAPCSQRRDRNTDQDQRSSGYSPVSARKPRFRSLSPHRSKPLIDAGDLRRSYSRSWMADEDSSDTDDLLDIADEVNRYHSLMGHEGSSILSPSSVEHQRQNGSPDLWEEVQKRVQSLLTSPKAVHRLACGATDSEIDEVLIRRSVLDNSCPL